MIRLLRSRYAFVPLVFTLITVALVTYRLGFHKQEEQPPVKQHPLYKPAPTAGIPPPLPEYFPLAAKASSPADIPPVPSWNRPPNPHVPEKTPLYIGFTRYWPLLQQVVLSYIAAGWPPEDIYVIENTGTFDANKRGLLTSQNPFYLDYRRLTEVFGVNVITLPSLQTFAQLQNFYLSEAVNKNLSYYFWGHMDVVALPHEDATPYRSLYQIAVDTIRESMKPDFGVDPETGKKSMWAIRFFAYDWLALFNAEAFQKVGGWDSMVGYYGTDCDMYSRLKFNDMISPIADAGDVFDVTDSLEDLEVLFRRRKKSSRSDSAPHAKRWDSFGSDLQNESATSPAFGATGYGVRTSSSQNAEIQKYLDETEEDERGGEGYHAFKAKLEAMQQAKRDDPYRNSWQLKQRGGQGEPYHYDVDGWEKALQMTIESGMEINREKWGHRDCDIAGTGLKEGDQWRVEHDW